MAERTALPGGSWVGRRSDRSEVIVLRSRPARTLYSAGNHGAGKRGVVRGPRRQAARHIPVLVTTPRRRLVRGVSARPKLPGTRADLSDHRNPPMRPWGRHGLHRGYLAVGLFGMAPPAMRIASPRAQPAGGGDPGTLSSPARGIAFHSRTFYPFAVLGFPFSHRRRRAAANRHLYYPAAGVILLLSSVQRSFKLCEKNRPADQADAAGGPHSFHSALLAGAVIAEASYRHDRNRQRRPFLRDAWPRARWVSVRRTAAVTAAHFPNLLDSAAALVGCVRVYPRACTGCTARLLAGYAVGIGWRRSARSSAAGTCPIRALRRTFWPSVLCVSGPSFYSPSLKPANKPPC